MPQINWDKELENSSQPSVAQKSIDWDKELSAPSVTASPNATISRSKPEDEGNALERFGTRFTGLPVHRIINDPNRYLNPFSKSYQTNNDPDIQPLIKGSMPSGPVQVPGADTYHDLKKHNYASALGDVAPGALIAAPMIDSAIAPAENAMRVPLWKQAGTTETGPHAPTNQPLIKGLLPKGPIEAQPTPEVQKPIAQPAASQIVRGPKGQMIKQFLTSTAEPGVGPTPPAKVEPAWQPPDLGPKAPPQVINNKLIHGPEEAESDIEQARRGAALRDRVVSNPNFNAQELSDSIRKIDNIHAQEEITGQEPPWDYLSSEQKTQRVERLKASGVDIDPVSGAVIRNRNMVPPENRPSNNPEELLKPEENQVKKKSLIDTLEEKMDNWIKSSSEAADKRYRDVYGGSKFADTYLSPEQQNTYQVEQKISELQQKLKTAMPGQVDWIKGKIEELKSQLPSSSIQVQKPGPGAAATFDPSFQSSRSLVPVRPKTGNFTPNSQTSYIASKINEMGDPNTLIPYFRGKNKYDVHRDAAVAGEKAVTNLERWAHDGGHFSDAGAAAEDLLRNGNEAGEDYSQHDLETARTVIDLVRHAPESLDTVFRGFRKIPATDELFGNLKNGDTLVLNRPSPFSKSSNIADSFSTSLNPNTQQWDDRYLSGYKLIVQGGHKGISLGNIGGYSEKEVISFGRFRVTQVSKPKQGPTKIYVKQIEVF